MCPVHLASGENVKAGEITFNKSKKKKVKFDVPFKVAPTIQLTLGDASNVPPYRVNVEKDEFWIKFKNKYTGLVSWTAISMGG